MNRVFSRAFAAKFPICADLRKSAADWFLLIAQLLTATSVRLKVEQLQLFREVVLVCE